MKKDILRKSYLPMMISYFCFDKVNENFLCSLSLPYDRRQEKDFISLLKKSRAFGIPEDEIIVRAFRKRNQIKDRGILRFASGVCLDFPANATSYDFKIIIAQLKVVAMSHKYVKE